ncbi:MAG: hypothetical protein J6R01_08245 [Alistipes sp.]|nr:hypothetical protein [Alistipes sp.]
MKVHLPQKPPLTKAQSKAVDDEVKRQILARKEEFYTAIDGAMLWTLRKTLGFGKKRLRRYFFNFIENYFEMCDAYEMTDTFPQRVKLERIGVDLDAWEDEATRMLKEREKQKNGRF